MRFCRYAAAEGARYGVVELIDGRDMIVANLPGPQMQVNAAGMPRRIVMGELDKAEKLAEPIELNKAHVLPPMPICSKIMCAGVNYRPHIEEMGHEVPSEPVIFSKPPSSLLAHGGLIQRPKISKRVDYEGELAIIIGQTCSQLREKDDVRDYILGYTILNDVTARDLQQKDGQWTRSKGFDTFCPVGPVVATDGVDPWAGIEIQTVVNGETRQQGNTRDLLFPVDKLIRHIAEFCTLMPGDIVSTGTPSGVGPMERGDLVEVWVEGIGVLRNQVGDVQ